MNERTRMLIAGSGSECFLLCLDNVLDLLTASLEHFMWRREAPYRCFVAYYNKLVHGKYQPTEFLEPL